MADSNPQQRRSSRARKSVSKFDPIDEKTYALLEKREAEKERMAQQPGEGDHTLGSIDYVAKQISKRGSTDEVLVLFHRALYGRDGKSTMRKVCRHVL